MSVTMMTPGQATECGQSACSSWNSEPDLVEIATPTPGAGEVLLRVDAAGLCHSDLHLMEWPEETVPYRLPFTLGHETAGTVVALGRRHEGYREGDRVRSTARWGCGRAGRAWQGSRTAASAQRRELGGHGGGVGCDGGLADYMLVPAVRYLVAIGDLDAGHAAPLTDAALTPYHAIKRCAHQLHARSRLPRDRRRRVSATWRSSCWRAEYSPVVAVDIRDDALELARSAGPT